MESVTHLCWPSLHHEQWWQFMVDASTGLEQFASATPHRCIHHYFPCDVCADGRQFMVDAGTGVANIPDKYRNEVSAQLEVLHRLAGAALNI
eukprot:scaffold137627_cov23-Tisochrysis_lutea.AAC.1